MSPEDLKAWRTGLGLTKSEAARRLGYGRSRYSQIEAGFDFVRKRPISAAPPIMALACAAIQFGIAPYPECLTEKK